jgi:hypothetical protein
MLISAVCIYAQSSIANTRIELKENRIHVTYDIENSDRNDRYNINLEVTDSNGEKLSLKSVSGDVGSEIPGGKRKEIVWDLEMDGIQMDAEIFFQVIAEAVPKPEPVQPEPIVEIPVVKDPVEEEAAEGDPAIAESEDQVPDMINTGNTELTEEVKKEGYSRTGLIFQSLVLPGLGLSRSTGNPHWIKGVAGYGCITTAVLLNRKAQSTYDLYLSSNSGEDAATYLKKTTGQDNLSEVCAYAAVGIWVMDMVWTLAGTARLSDPLSVGSSFDPVSRVPMLALRYKF